MFLFNPGKKEGAGGRLLLHPNLLTVDDVETFLKAGSVASFPSAEIIYSFLPLRDLGSIDSCRHTSYIDVEDELGCCHIAVVVLIAESLS